MQGGPLMHVIAAKAVAFARGAETGVQVSYQRQVIANAKRLCEELQRVGFPIVSGGTDNHLLLVDVFTKYGVGGKIAEAALDAAGITVNKNMIPLRHPQAARPVRHSHRHAGTDHPRDEGNRNDCDRRLDSRSPYASERYRETGEIEARRRGTLRTFPGPMRGRGVKAAILIVALAMLTALLAVFVGLFLLSCRWAGLPRPRLITAVGVVFATTFVWFFLEAAFVACLYKIYDMAGYPPWEVWLVGLFAGLPVSLAAATLMHVTLLRVPTRKAVQVWFIERLIRYSFVLAGVGAFAVFFLAAKK